MFNWKATTCNTQPFLIARAAHTIEESAAVDACHSFTMRSMHAAAAATALYVTCAPCEADISTIQRLSASIPSTTNDHALSALAASPCEWACPLAGCFAAFGGIICRRAHSADAGIHAASARMTLARPMGCKVFKSSSNALICGFESQSHIFFIMITKNSILLIVQCFEIKRYPTCYVCSIVVEPKKYESWIHSPLGPASILRENF